MRKTGNIVIRDSLRKNSRELMPPIGTLLSPAQKPEPRENRIFNESKMKELRRGQHLLQEEASKEAGKAEALTQGEQEQIRTDVKRSTGKKFRLAETRIEADMVAILESECAQLGSELERVRIENQRLNEELRKCRPGVAGRGEGRIHTASNLLASTFGQNGSESSEKLKGLEQQVRKLRAQNQALTEGNEKIASELQARDKQIQAIRQAFIVEKQKWAQQYGQVQTKASLDSSREENRQHSYTNQQEAKNEAEKMGEKNTLLQKQLLKYKQAQRQMEEVISTLKKRLADTALLKTRGAAVMNQKLARLMEQNQRLRDQVDVLRGKQVEDVEYEKPVLFGPEDRE